MHKFRQAIRELSRAFSTAGRRPVGGLRRAPRGSFTQPVTRYLISKENPEGHKPEDLLRALRKDILTRCTKIVDDQRAEANHVLDNTMKILNLLSDACKAMGSFPYTLIKARSGLSSGVV